MDAKTGLFYVFAAVLLFAAFRVITARNPVHAALYLVLAFFQAAAVWILLKAEFLAITLVLVYVGAVMVLFLFVVMLLNVRGETPLLTPGAAKGFGFFFALIAFVEFLWIVLTRGGAEGTQQPAAVLPPGFGSPAEIGRILYSTWLFPFEVTSILLLVAVIGAVVLAKRKFV